MFGPTLVGSKVTLAPLGPEHLESYCRWFADPEVTRFLKLQSPPTLAEEHEWFARTAASQVDLVWGIFGPEGQHLGSTGIRRIDWRNRRAITGIVIGERSWWGRGIASAAHALRTRYAFDELNLEKLVTTVMEGNTASRRALERVGYRTVGVHRRHEFRQGRWLDTWVGELLREEWSSGAGA
jgi:RimJ/RimL family protein N-acetyltransferase